MQTQASIAGDLGAADILDAVERICRDPTFARAERLRRFLKHAVNRTLGGEADSLKESLLGREVFDRGPEFDPKADPIVRIDARRLRRKLGEYYGGAGSGDAIRIAFATGAYVPSFDRTSAAPGSAGGELVLAVLPFRNLSVSVETEFFSEGLSEAVLNTVAHEPNIRAITRNSSFQWGEAGLEPATLRTRFGVQRIIQGSVQTRGSECRVTAQMIETKDSVVSWSREFRGDFARWFDLQEDVCGEVLHMLRGKAAMRRRPAPGRGDRAAWQLFLRAHHELAKGNPESFPDVLRLLGEAVERDPTLSAAWATFAHIHCTLGLVLGRSPREMVRKAREFAGRALALNPDEPDAKVTLGIIQLFGDFDFRGALRTFTQVIDSHGEHVGGRINRALYCLAGQGDLEEAEAEIQGILEIDPLNVHAQVVLGQIFYFQHRFDEAVERFESVGEFSPEFASARFYAMLALLEKGDWARALEAFDVQAKLIPYPCIRDWADAIRALARGDKSRAIEIIDQMEPAALDDPRAVSVFVDGCVRIGDVDRAIAGLERMFQTRHFRLLHIRVDPAYDSLRGDPRFQMLAGRVTKP